MLLHIGDAEKAVITLLENFVGDEGFGDKADNYQERHDIHFVGTLLGRYKFYELLDKKQNIMGETVVTFGPTA